MLYRQQQTYYATKCSLQLIIFKNFVIIDAYKQKLKMRLRHINFYRTFIVYLIVFL